MGSCIVKLGGKYLEWSTMVDAPVTRGLTRKELREHIRWRYGEEGLRRLPARLKLVESRGTSMTRHTCVEDTVRFNRAGKNEQCLTVEQLIEKYCSGDADG